MQVDELVLKLIMDTSLFEKGQRKADESFKKTKEDLSRHGKDIEAASKGMGLALNAVANELAKMLSAFLSLKAVKDITGRIVELDSATGRTAKTLGMSAQELAAWDAIARQAGGTAGEAAGALQSFADSFSQLQISGKSAALEPLFRSVGLAGKEAENIDISKGPMAALSAFAHNIEVIARTNPALAHSLGLSVLHSEALTQQFMAGGSQLDKMLAAQGEFNHLTKEDVEAAQQRVIWWNKFSDTLLDTFRRLNTEALTPIIIGMEKGAIALLEWNQRLEEFNHKLGKADGIGQIFFDNFIKPIVEGIENMADKIGTAFKHAFGAALDWLKNEILSITGGLASIFGISTAHAEGSAGGAGMGGATGAGLRGGGGSRFNRGASGAFSGGAAGSATNGSTADAMRVMRDQLIKEGVSEGNATAAAAALVGNAMQESRLNPKAVHDQGTGYGIYGARLGRRARMFAWLKAHGYAMDSLEGQARYMAHEAMTDPAYGATRRALMGATTGNLSETTHTIERNFESPAPGSTGARIGYATGALRKGIAPPKIAVPQSPAPGATTNNHSSVNSNNNTTSTNQTSFNGGITVNTNSNNGMQIARDIQDTLRRTAYGAQANYSLA